MSAMKYKADFCKANKCTPEEFEKAYIRFMKKDGKPSQRAYLRFAKRWNIKIHKGLGDPTTEAVLSVNIAAIKVMASSDVEADAAVHSLILNIGKSS